MTTFLNFLLSIKKTRMFKVLPNGSTSYVKRVFAGGNRSFATITRDSNENLYDSRIYESNTQIECMTIDLIKSCAQIDENAWAELSLMTSMEYIFKNVACINASFLLANDEHNYCSVKNHGLNIEDATAAFKLIQTIKKETLKEIVSFFRFSNRKHIIDFDFPSAIDMGWDNLSIVASNGCISAYNRY